MSIHIKNDTPVDSLSLCSSCVHAHIMRGHRESEELVYCNFVYELILVPFQVRESSTTPTAAA